MDTVDVPAVLPPPANDDAVASNNDAKIITPRNYQIEIYEVALRKNTISLLDTGAGKTFISIMLMKEIGKDLSRNGVKQLMIFLAPTVHLVNQQFKVIENYTEFPVAEYYGAKGMDEWSAALWQEEMRLRDVMVMTPQILLDALRKGFISMDIIRLLIFDECHRASGNHPYARIMKEFYHQSSIKPQVFGMTASPVIGKGVTSVSDCEEQIASLEALLDSTIFAVEDRTELESCVPSALEYSWLYDPAPIPYTDLKTKLQALWDKIHASITKLETLPTDQFSDINDKIKLKLKDFSCVYMKILHCLDELGLICAREAVLVCIDTCHAPSKSDTSTAEISSMCTAFLKEALKLIEEQLPHDPYQAMIDHREAIRLGYASPKLYELMRIIQTFDCSSQVLCLIFVERIIVAKVIDRFMKQLSCLSQFTFSYLTGGNSSKDALTHNKQKKVLELFRSGEINLVFSTDVAEEGMDVRNCSYVIRFDLPKTVRSYVQSRGRARQIDSKYYLMIERGNVKQRDLIYTVLTSARSVTNTALNRDVESCVPHASNYKVDAYVVESTKATVTTNSSISLINKYCGKLPGIKQGTPKPNFLFSRFEGTSGESSFSCSLTLPPSAPFRTIVGPMSNSSPLAKQLVCLEACKRLHQLGVLDDHLLPTKLGSLDDLPLVEKCSGGDVIEKTEAGSGAEKCSGVDDIVKTEACSGPGTTKRKELHGTAAVRALSGTWAHKSDPVTLQGFKISFTCDVETYTDFLLLMEADIDDDVANIDFDCFLVNKTAKASVTPWGQVFLKPEQIEKAKSFQELLFNGMFGRLWTKPSSGQRSFLLKLNNNELWESSRMYLLLPFNSISENPSIDWSAVSSCASVVKHMIKIHSEQFQSPATESTAVTEVGLDVVHLANKSVDVSDLKEMVVMATHTGKIYSVLNAVLDMSADSPFHAESSKLKVASFAEYFRVRYQFELKYPKQPLLLLKQTHNAFNLLSSGLDLKGSSHSNKKGLVEKPQCHVYMPPELLVHIDISIHVLKAMYLLPSVMYRLESLMLASQLRAEIGFQLSVKRIPILLMLEAITSLRCCEDFSYERLELLGDSVLKYSVSSQLYLRWPDKHEGQLSTCRSRAVCNSTLHKLGTKRNIQGYLRDAAFEARRWSAPGQACIFPDPCKCAFSSSEVMIDGTHVSEDSDIVCGKACDMGHRWICSKNIADCLEALIGAYYVGGGLDSAVDVMRWFGIDVDLSENLAFKAKKNAEFWDHERRAAEIKALETKIGYVFETKGLLLEAMTHATQQENGSSYCYQRLEFLGDAVLDVLITRYLFNTYTSIDPGELTDLRSASVNNENFAQAAVKHNLQQHLLHCSGLVSKQVNAYVKRLLETDDNADSSMKKCLKGPKVVADIVESIAGAVLIDTKMDLDKVWMIFEPLLSPIVTPENLELAPMRELIELCCHLGLFINSKCQVIRDVVVIELGVQLKDVLLVREGKGKTRKTAKERAAVLLLEDLQLRGISHTRCSSKRKNCEDASESPTHSEEQNCPPTKKQRTSELSVMDMDFSLPVHKAHQTGRLHSSKRKYHEDENDCCTQTENEKIPPTKKQRALVLEGQNDGLLKPSEPVKLTFTLAKGGPRTAIYNFCKEFGWPTPTYTANEHKSKTLQLVSDGPDKKEGFISFTTTAVFHIPNYKSIEITGEKRGDKKSSQDSAAFALLKAIEKLGMCVLDLPQQEA